ncbi:MAG: TetR/AcrR family transcriptional regulator [Frankiales bacterium]|nr:TetR/AcrR family transcriptional regulator [Frankiales bacterium]
METGRDGAATAPSRRHVIVAAAAELFHRQGFERTSTQEIADAVGLLKGSLYHHVRSKGDVLFAIMQEVHDDLQANADRAAAAEGSPVEQVVSFIEGHLDVVLGNLTWGRVYSQELGALDVDRRERIIRERGDYERALRSLVATAQSAGQLRTDVDARLLTLWILTSLNSLYRWYQADGPMTPLQIKSSYCSMVMSGALGRDRA